MVPVQGFVTELVGVGYTLNKLAVGSVSQTLSLSTVQSLLVGQSEASGGLLVGLEEAPLKG